MMQRLALHEPAVYQIQFQGGFDQCWVEYLDPSLSMCVNTKVPQATTTTLTGEFADQAALMGLLNHLYALGLPLLLVRRIV